MYACKMGANLYYCQTGFQSRHQGVCSIPAGGLRLLKAESADLNLGLGIEGVGAHRQREEEGVVLLQMLHVGQPLREEQDMDPFDIADEVLIITVRQG